MKTILIILLIITVLVLLVIRMYKYSIKNFHKELIKNHLSKHSWFLKVYAQEIATLTPYLITCAVTVTLSSLFSFNAKPVLHMESDALIVLITRTIDLLSFWPLFILLLIRQDKKELGRPFTKEEKKEKIKEYFLLSAIVEVIYFIIASIVQYIMQYYGIDPGYANFIILGSAILFFIVFLPPIRYFSKKSTKNKQRYEKRIL